MSSTLALRTRDDIQEASKWQIEALYPSIQEWEKEFDSLKKEKAPYFPDLEKFRGKLNQSASLLKEAIEYILTITRKIEKLYTYAHMKNDESIGREDSKSIYEKIQWLSQEFSKEKSFFEPELLSLSEETIDKYLKSPELKEYRFFLEKIVRLKPHTLSEDKEMLLASLKKPLSASSKAFTALNNADIKFPEVKDSEGKSYPLTHGLYSLYLRSHDRTLRKNSFQTLHLRYSEHENTLTELISGEMESEIFIAKARAFKSSLESALYPWSIPESVYRNLISTVRKNLPVLHRYVSLKKRLLDLPKVHFYDLYALPSLIKDPSFSKEEAVNLVLESVKPLGDEYYRTLERGFKEERWVDWEESISKRSGAYSSGCYDSFPYILMNFRGTLRDMFTLAHEGGHSMHSYLSRKNQPYQNYHYPIFVAEIASTVNEELLSHALFNKMKKKEERLLLIHERIEDIRATLLRQTLFAEFELKLSELAESGAPLTPKTIKDLFYSLNRDYYGPDIELDPEVAIEWSRIPHFYFHFYVYQYATGIAAALALSQKVLRGDSSSYLKFLSAGGSAFPLDLVKLAGIDLSKPDPISAALKRFNDLLDEFESLSNGR